MMALQLVDSELATTRHYWRKVVWGFPDAIAEDPRPMKEILGFWPDWRTGRLDTAPATTEEIAT